MKRRVLVVDDEPTILILLGLAFEEAGLTLEAAASAEEATQLLETTAFDAVLVDKNLPGRNGIELVRWIRERNRTVPLVVMTGFASPESARDALNLGIDSYIEKPFPNVTEVPELLTQLVESGRPGWLPGQAGTSVALPAGGARPARLLLATTSSHAGALGDPLVAAAPPGSTLELQSTLHELLDAVSATPRPDVVVVDFDLFDEIVQVVEAIRERSEFVSIAVVTTNAPPLRILQQLILLGVTQLIDRKPEAYAVHVARVLRGLRT